jgi:NAD(P)-dependent dehydrogenase (short-subunit alcohol dehydrogenase family)
MESLKGKVVLVTGASRGIGLAIARKLGGEGAQLILVARNRKHLRASAKKIQGAPLPVVADVTRPTEVARLFRTLHRHHKKLDVLVNSAGVFTYKPFVRTTLQDWRANLDTNLTALFLTTRAALPLLQRSPAAHIVNILSVSSRSAFRNCSAYCAAKFGALGLTRVLREEFRPLGIRVTAILPGSTDTRMVKAFDFPVDRAKLIQPQDIAEAVLAALLQPSRTTVEEVFLMPSAGRL